LFFICSETSVKSRSMNYEILSCIKENKNYQGWTNMRIAICDDEKIIQEELKREVDKYFNFLDILTVCFSSGEELIADFEKNQYDLVFLDIEMKGLSGLQVAKHLHTKTKDLPIVLVTSHTELAMEGYEVQAFRFLAKPINTSKLQNTLNELEKLIFDDDKISIYSDGLHRYIRCKSICYIKSENVYLNIVTTKDKYLVRQKLKQLTNEISSKNFTQVHRSFIVNLKYVESFDGENIYMEDGIKIPVSKSNREIFKTQMLKYMKRNSKYD